MGTARLPKRIRLTQEQIDSIKVKPTSEVVEIEDRRCSTCLEEFTEDDLIKVLPCDNRHIFHPECIDPWFKRKTNCPLCKKDMREFLDPDYNTPDPVQSQDPIAENEPGLGDGLAANEEHQQALLNNLRDLFMEFFGSEEMN
jgi:hypothetical protein